MYKTIRLYILSLAAIVVLFVLLQFITWYISLIAAVLLPAIITGSKCGINPHLAFCNTLNSPNYHLFIKGLSYVLALSIAIVSVFPLLHRFKSLS